MSCSPWGPGFVAPIAARIVSARLGLSVGRPGPHDFASASAPFVRTNDRARRQCVHRIPASRVVTIAIRPLHRGEMAGENHAFLKNESAIFLRQELTAESLQTGIESLHEFPIFAHAVFSVRGPSPRSDLQKISQCRANQFRRIGMAAAGSGLPARQTRTLWIAVMAINTMSDRRLHDQSALFAAQAVRFGSELFAAAPPARRRACGGPSAGSKGMQQVQCFAMNASTFSLKAWGFSNSSP